MEVFDTNLTESERQMIREASMITPGIMEMYEQNRRVSQRTFYLLIAAYSVLICVGVCGNMLVVWVVLRKPAMRTARNLFILNLAISDLLLCLITMPLTLMEILTRYWPLGDNAFICKIIAPSQATSIFVSTFSITAIALDRYQLIVNPTRDSLQRVGAVSSLGVIWVASMILASPLFMFKSLVVPMNTTQITEHLMLGQTLAFCYEDWPIEHGRGLYSGVCLLFQYVVPICIVSIAYSQICRKLQYRQVAARSSTCRRRSRDERRRKTNSLLVAIAVIYCVSWLPLNVCNITLDFRNSDDDNQNDHEMIMIIYAVCHMCGMSSAVSNPMLYGWLNDNFRKEFKEILSMLWIFPNASRPSWLMSMRSSSATQPRSQNRSASAEKIGMKAKRSSFGEEEGPTKYADEMKAHGAEETKGMEITRTNVTHTTSLDQCEEPTESEQAPTVIVACTDIPQ